METQIPKTANATAARRRAGQETMAAKLSAAGWTVIPPERRDPVDVPVDQRFLDYARERLEACLGYVLASGSDTEILGAAQLALMALTTHFGGPETIVLTVSDVVECVDAVEPECICPPDLVARGGFRSGCPVHHLS
jgi:hypothetical protein